MKKVIGRFEAVEKWLESKKYSVIDLKLGNWGAIASFLWLPAKRGFWLAGGEAERSSDVGVLPRWGILPQWSRQKRRKKTV